MDDFLNVRQTAQRLGVHENTVRNWAREGLLPDARIPGSRSLRFRAADVDRLIAQRGARTVPSLQTERLTARLGLAGASDLREWPETRARDAQETFPELVRRLLAETPGVTNVSIRAGDGIAVGGYDGMADSPGTTYLPAGRLLFEFGTGKHPAAKAAEDYDKRKSTAPSASVFVFATPRRWAGAPAWAEERKHDGFFADVRVLDADDLEGWLRASPGAHHWISEHLGLRPRGATSLDEWWESFASSTDPRLPADLFLAGRSAQVDQLLQLLSGPATVTVVQTDWTQDGVAFVHASLAGVRDAVAPPIATPVVVSSAEVWESILGARGTSLLIPVFEEPSIGRAVEKGHHVIAVLDRSSASRRSPDVVLPRLGRQDADEALRAAGIGFERASRLAALGRRSLPALRRELSLDPRVNRPDWSRAPDAMLLAPLMLVGSWTESEDDLAVLETVTGREYPVLEPILHRLRATSDPVVRRVGDTWMLTSPEEAFVLLKESLSRDSLERVLTTAIDVLSEPDPVRALPPGERIMAGIRGIRRPHSATVRRGLAEGLALLGAMGSDTALTDGGTLAAAASRAVDRLVSDANADSSGRLWGDLAGVLPLIAEAAPEEFLRAVTEDVRRDRPVLLSLFQEEDGSDSLLGPSSPHPHLLWALETLCWPSEYLPDAALALALLASRDPGGRLANRPIESLASVLCGWVRHTSASLVERIRALDVVFETSGEVGWNLTFRLWPENHAFATPPAGPRFRDWRPTSTSVPIAEWVGLVRALVDRAIDHAGVDPDRLGQLAEGMDTVPADERERIMALLETLASGPALDRAARLTLWDRLRALSARHERSPDAEWAMPEDARTRLAALVNSFEPTSEPRRFAYLFGGRVDLPELDRHDFRAYDEALERMRSSALRSVLDVPERMESLERFTQSVEMPSLVGTTLAALDEVGLAELLPWLGSSDPALSGAGTAWAQRTTASKGPRWLADALRHPEVEGVAREVIIRNSPPNRETWRTLDDSPNRDDVDTYWTGAPIMIVEPADSTEAIEQLTRHGRAWSAVTVAAYSLQDAARSDRRDSNQDLDADLVVQLLDAALLPRPEGGVPLTSADYELGMLLDYLAKFPELEDSVARYEFAFFRLLEHSREPRALSRALARQPELFVDLAKTAFRGRSEPQRTLSKEEQDHATHAYLVLHEWHGVPGGGDDGHLDAEAMRSWVVEARLMFSEVDRSDIGDELIGQALARCHVGDDGVWPAIPVRDLLEMIGSHEVEGGLVVGRLNSRGVTTRSPFDGGRQERDLARQFDNWSKSTRSAWPRTARVLRSIAESYEADARREDVRAELDADRG